MFRAFFWLCAQGSLVGLGTLYGAANRERSFSAVQPLRDREEAGTAGQIAARHRGLGTEALPRCGVCLGLAWVEGPQRSSEARAGVLEEIPAELRGDPRRPPLPPFPNPQAAGIRSRCPGKCNVTTAGSTTCGTMSAALRVSLGAGRGWGDCSPRDGHRGAGTGNRGPSGLISESGGTRGTRSARCVGLLITRAPTARLSCPCRFAAATPRPRQLRRRRAPSPARTSAAQPAPAQRRSHAGPGGPGIPRQPHRAGALLW